MKPGTTQGGKKREKSHREKKSGVAHDRWLQQKQARNAANKQTWAPGTGWEHAAV